MSNHKHLAQRLEAVPDPAVRELCRDAAAYIRSTSEPAEWYEAKIHIAAVAAPLILELAEKHMGYPGALHSSDGSDPLGHECKTYHVASKKWKEILMEIHWGLERVLIDDMDVLEENETRFKASMELFGKWFPYLWD